MIQIETKRPLRLFDGYGVEMEYMIVDKDTLDVLPVSDKILEAIAGEITSEVSRGALAWSNELVMHVIEIKTDGPAAGFQGLSEGFQAEVSKINEILAGMNARLMPGAMHPWMDPFTEMKLWPHEYNPIYEAYNRIFDCRGHGWANLQSTHLNLPFNGDQEFEKLNAALRILTPLLPALSACSPIADGEQKPFLDYRMEVYRTNSDRIPSVAGLIIPEAHFSRDAYYEHVFGPMYRDVAPLDPEGILQEEWLNSRGVMARFDRGAVEVRVIDIQECPKADLAILALFTAVTQALTEEKWSSLEEQKKWHEKDLYEILMSTATLAEKAEISDPRYLRLFGSDKTALSAGQLWQHLYDAVKDSDLFTTEHHETLALMFRHGPLGRRILKALPQPFTKADLKSVYGKLCDCLESNELFLP